MTDEGTQPQKRSSHTPRPLTTDQRAWFVILSLYMAVFCLCTFAYWEDIPGLSIAGWTAASAGLFLFVAAFFNTEARGQSESRHPFRSYLFSFFCVLLSLFLLRVIDGLIPHVVVATMVLYSGAVIALIVFRKAMLQVVSVMLAVVFLFITFDNWDDVLSGRMTFRNAIEHSRQVIFKIGPIREVANLLISGNYVGYLSRIDYRDREINVLAIQTVKGSGDDPLLKTQAILDYVSNEIFYVSDPRDGIEFAKDPATTLIAGGGDCEDQALLLCSMLESVGVKTYIALTDTHVFVLVPFGGDHYPELQGIRPHVFVDGVPCYSLEATDSDARVGGGFTEPEQITRVLDVRKKTVVSFSLQPDEEVASQ
jgi:hypothetical protein